MINILNVGMNPHTVDLTDPGFPPGLTPEIVEKGIEAGKQKLKEIGYDLHICFIDTGNLDLSHFIKQLTETQFEGVVIGAGVRLPPPNFILFEKLVNAVHEHAPDAKIIFNTNPHDTAEAIKRWI